MSNLLRNIDLNLLVYLDVLLDEQSISRAAKRLNLTQPALSNALARLRGTFNDDLLVKVGRKMSATSFARTIHEPLKRSLEQISENVLTTNAFDPYKEMYRFVTAFHGYEEAVITPEILRQFVAFPGISLANQTPNKVLIANQLFSGAIHFTSTIINQQHADIVTQPLLSDHFVCVASREFRPFSMSASEYYQQKHLLITPNGEGSIVDALLSHDQRQRRIKLTVSEFGSAPLMLINDESLITSVPHRLALIWQKHFSVQILPCPLNIPPHQISISWHKSLVRLPAMTWFKVRLFASANTSFS